MADLMVLSFQTDMTRVVTMPFANDGSNRNYKMIGVSDGHHSMSHHNRDSKKMDNISKINNFHVEQLAYLSRQNGIRKGSRRVIAARQPDARIRQWPQRWQPT